MGFDRVEQLMVDDHFKDQGDQQELDLEVRKKEEEFIAKNITERMKEGRKDCPEWKAEVPLVRVVRGLAWASYIE